MSFFTDVRKAVLTILRFLQLFLSFENLFVDLGLGHLLQFHSKVADVKASPTSVVLVELVILVEIFTGAFTEQRKVIIDGMLFIG